MVKGGKLLKIEKLNENKLKITLDINDLKSRNIDVKSFVSNTPESQDLFWDVMQEAEKEYGFNVDESMICVEANISPAGNFTLIITKTASNIPAPKSVKKPVPTNFKLKRKDIPETLDNSLYEFSNLENLVSFCKLAKETDYCNTSLYNYEGKYYLHVKDCFNKSILEYSSKVLDRNYKFARIEEYGNLIYKNDALGELKKQL